MMNIQNLFAASPIPANLTAGSVAAFDLASLAKPVWSILVPTRSAAFPIVMIDSAMLDRIGMITAFGRTKAGAAVFNLAKFYLIIFSAGFTLFYSALSAGGSWLSCAKLTSTFAGAKAVLPARIAPESLLTPFTNIIAAFGLGALGVVADAVAIFSFGDRRSTGSAACFYHSNIILQLYAAAKGLLAK